MLALLNVRWVSNFSVIFVYIIIKQLFIISDRNIFFRQHLFLKKKSIIEITSENDKFLYNYFFYILIFFIYWKKMYYITTTTMPSGQVSATIDYNQHVSYFNYLKRMQKTDIFFFFQYSSLQWCRWLHPIHRCMCSVLWRLIKKSHIFSSDYNETRNKLTLIPIIISFILVVATAAILVGLVTPTKSISMFSRQKKSM